MEWVQTLFPHLATGRLALLTLIEIVVNSVLFWWLVNRFGKMDGRLRLRRCMLCTAMICTVQILAIVWMRLPMALVYIRWMFYLNVVTGLLFWFFGSLWAIRVTLNMPRGGVDPFLPFCPDLRAHRADLQVDLGRIEGNWLLHEFQPAIRRD